MAPLLKCLTVDESNEAELSADEEGLKGQEGVSASESSIDLTIPKSVLFLGSMGGSSFPHRHRLRLQGR